jgi:Outer membrane protein beta-barrel domain
MKKFIIFGLIACSTITVNAQRKKTRANTSQGNWAVRVALGYNSENSDPVGVPEQSKSNTLQFNPSVGYFIADNLEIGLNLDLQNKNESETFTATNKMELSGTSIGFGIYGQKYFPVNNWFAFTGRLDLGLANGNNKITSTINNIVTPTDQGDNNFGGSANFGLAFTPVNNLAIQANIIGIGAISGTLQNQANTPDVNYSRFGLNVWRQPTNVSLTWFFGRGMSAE